MLCAAVLSPFVAATTTKLPADEPVLQWNKPIGVPGIEEESVVAAPLDAEVFAATQDDLDDIRIFDGDGNAVPFLLRKAPTTSSRTERIAWTPEKRTVRPLDGGGLEITIELDDDEDRPFPNGLTLVTPLINFEQRVRVETSADGAAWEVVADALTFDYSRYMDARNVRIPFPETDRRFFRITIDDVTAEQESQLLELTRRLQGGEETERSERLTVDRRPFRIDRIEFWRERERPQDTGAVLSSYPVQSFAAAEDGKTQQTVITIETQREPLTTFRLETPSRNFSRRAEVQVEFVSGVRTEWRPIGAGTLSRIDFQSIQQDELELQFPETRAARYRIVIDNRDSPPLQVDGVAATGVVYEAIYFAAADGAYTLAYGDEQAKAAQYDVAALQSLLNTGIQPLLARLGPETAAPAAGPRPTNWKELVNNPALLITIVVVLVLALGWALYHAVKRVDATPPGEGG